MSKKQNELKIGKAKGRPMLMWVGKQPLDRVTAWPAQHVERFQAEAPDDALDELDWSDWPDKYERGGLLFHGDNKDVLAHLLANGFRGKVKLIYIDPPFDSGADYVRKVQLRGNFDTSKIEGEEYTLGEQVQYTDIWANDNYLQFMYERILLLKELLSEDGSIVLHCDDAKSHHLRCLLDEVFGAQNFRNEIIWGYAGGGIPKTELPHKHDSLFWYSKSDIWTYKPVFRPYSEGTVQRGRTRVKGEGAKLRDEGTPVNDWWDDVQKITSPDDPEKAYYPTQKSVALLDRIAGLLTRPSDLILDCFIGSGTTAVSAQNLGRRWIGCDINKGAIHTTAKRLQSLMRQQAEAAADPLQASLDETDQAAPRPAQLSFTTWRVNDYDLQIQHNEAVALACEHIGITRSRTDGFFDGHLGNRLVKIIPFNHPLSPLDLEDIDAELKRRPEEERDVTVVALGMELAARHWVDQHNRNRPVNRYHIIELRTDSKYGGFIKHEPLEASISVSRKGDMIEVTLEDVFSPTIVQRLNMESGVFRARIDDWRAVVDCILIDTDYDGEVFNVALSDIPEKKTDLVDGRYELPAPQKGSTVAVKIIDMLGEELIVASEA
ncbi:DNA methyltransferase [Wenzhouxiangella sp. EGI_FJ10409]|uniref:DNA methyltransferase n=1 Tax=Wenzhouxiangella sp. EGI_FJ10409 TaxID=3243767 RepID=UPI0035D630F4